MSTVLTLPRLGETMEVGRVVAWLKKPGDTFRRGETIVEIDSDKTVVELPALADGTLLEVLAAEGTDVDVGAPLCLYEAEGDATPPPKTSPSAEAAAAVPASSAPVVSSPAGADSLPQERRRATPLARRLARQHGLSLDVVTGTGRRGRIDARDVLAAAEKNPGETELAVRRWPLENAGRTALMLHGFGGDAQTWAGLASAFGRVGMASLAPDLPGHGETAIEAADMDALAAPLGPLLQEAAREKPIDLVGHSMGAAVALALARRHPECVARLTLIAPVGLGDAIDADFILGFAKATAPGTIAHLLRRLSPRPPVLSQAQLELLAASARRLDGLAKMLVADGRQRLDIVPDLANLPMPVRVIWGLADAVLPWRQVERLPSRVAIHLIAGAGHMPQADAPQEVAALFAG